MRYTLPLKYVEAIVRCGSIRKAAEVLAITSTALNRRILSMEDELGVELFERLARGVRLTSAGEIFLHHARMQLADLERVKSQIADLKGVRRGHIAIASSQALLPSFLPKQIASYRAQHPGVTFEVLVRDRSAAEQSLVDMSADLAIVFEPLHFANFQILHTEPQRIDVIMSENHPLARKDKVRLSECLQYPMGLPQTRSGIYHLLDVALQNSPMKLEPAIISDSFEFLRYHAMHEEVLTFQIPVGIPENTALVGLVTRPLDEKDVPRGVLYLGQLRGRTLSVAAAKFANHLISALAQEQ